MTDHVRELLALLDLEDLDKDLFRGSQPPSKRPRVFGGQVAAQAMVAGSRTVEPEFHVHSLHSYFLLPGDYSVPIIYDVERIRDGRSFATRRVMARQHGKPIYYQTINFQREEAGLEHQDVMPTVPPPEHGVDVLGPMGEGTARAPHISDEWAALECRRLRSPDQGDTDPSHPAQVRMWVRVKGEVGDDAGHHLALFTYASDMSLLGAALAAHDVSLKDVQVASLDHTIWFHRPLRTDEWWLYDQWSPSASGGRGLALGRVFQGGVLAATVAQEGLIRPRSR